MAGLGEACSHIAALLFAAEAYTKLSKDYSCTSESCRWLPPSMQNVKYAPISDINFSAPFSKKKKMMLDESLGEVAVPQSSNSELVPSPSKEE